MILIKVSEKKTQIVQIVNFYKVNKHIKFYPYNVDYQDKGWGCAWRSIQTILSPFYQTNFKQLLQTYSSKNYLTSIYLRMIKEQQVGKNIEVIETKLKNKKWAPQECIYWAQPFIGQLILYQMNIKTKLLLLNGYPSLAHAPQQVFQYTLYWEQFKQMLIEHFKTNATPIMIDDGSYCLTIISATMQNNTLKILFADPHIYNNCHDKLRKNGIYWITYSYKGDIIENTITEQQKLQRSECYKSIYFNKKLWMVLIITNKSIQ